MWNPCINHISCQTFGKSICNQTRLALPATQTTQYLPPLLNIDTHGLYCRRKKRMFCKKENKQLNFCYSMIYHHVISCRNWTFLDFYLHLFFFFYQIMISKEYWMIFFNKKKIPWSWITALGYLQSDLCVVYRRGQAFVVIGNGEERHNCRKRMNRNVVFWGDGSQ